VPAAADALVVQRRRRVEGLGGRRPPVDQQRFLPPVLRGQPDAADVPGDVGVAAVQPAEAEAGVRGVEGDQPLGVELDGGLALADGLRVVRRAGQRLVQPVDHVCPDVVQPPVQSGHVALFGRQLGLAAAGGWSCRQRNVSLPRGSRDPLWAVRSGVRVGSWVRASSSR
jgi:hypothetical protein